MAQGKIASQKLSDSFLGLGFEGVCYTEKLYLNGDFTKKHSKSVWLYSAALQIPWCRVLMRLKAVPFRYGC